MNTKRAFNKHETVFFDIWGPHEFTHNLLVLFLAHAAQPVIIKRRHLFQAIFFCLRRVMSRASVQRDGATYDIVVSG